ncbi:hypothetical protein GCM10008957_32120 [Deinococcus ruber]|uniref:Uncharacterized protein n=1 Tax=Deinococcus ruber TaxID=1848197 RepID=A0A918CCP0_9DEIO|nr:hypothetical protein GCM10008957_32120 [Deinococcus ruber]
MIDSGISNNFAFLYRGPVGVYLDLISSTDTFSEMFINEKKELAENAVAAHNYKTESIESRSAGIKFVDGEGIKISDYIRIEDNEMSIEEFYSVSNFLLEVIKKIRCGQFSYREVPDIAQEIYNKTRILNELIKVFEIIPTW